MEVNLWSQICINVNFINTNECSMLQIRTCKLDLFRCKIVILHTLRICIDCKVYWFFSVPTYNKAKGSTNPGYIVPPS